MTSSSKSVLIVFYTLMMKTLLRSKQVGLSMISQRILLVPLLHLLICALECDHCKTIRKKCLIHCLFLATPLPLFTPSLAHLTTAALSFLFTFLSLCIPDSFPHLLSSHLIAYPLRSKLRRQRRAKGERGVQTTGI